MQPHWTIWQGFGSRRRRRATGRRHGRAQRLACSTAQHACKLPTKRLTPPPLHIGPSSSRAEQHPRLGGCENGRLSHLRVVGRRPGRRSDARRGQGGAEQARGPRFLRAVPSAALLAAWAAILAAAARRGDLRIPTAARRLGCSCRSPPRSPPLPAAAHRLPLTRLLRFLALCRHFQVWPGALHPPGPPPEP